MKRFLVLALVLLAVAACSSTQPATDTPKPLSTPGLTLASIGMGDNRDVQYMPFLVADSKGYFAEEGLRVEMGWGFSYDGVTLVSQNKIEFALATGDQVLQARSKGLPVVYVANLTGDLPIEVISLKSRNIATPHDLVGKKVGLLCLCGPDYAAWLALLKNQNIDPASVNAVTIGTAATQQLTDGTVDAAVVYANAQPLDLKQSGQEINEIKTWDYVHLPGKGLITGEADIQNKPDLVQRFLSALNKGEAETMANPDATLQLSYKLMPWLAGANAGKTATRLDVTIGLWKRSPLGATSSQDWQSLAGLMSQTGLTNQPVDPGKAFTNRFVQ